MTNIASWNIRGLNWPNKQEEIKHFLHKHDIGIVGLLETKVKIPKVETIASKIFPRWRWHHNFNQNAKGRIWLAWKPSAFNLDIILTTDQLIHCKATQVATKKHFYLTVVYGMNHENQRIHLWHDLHDLSQRMSEAWCILGYFNAVMYKNDRIGGNEVTDREINELQDVVSLCELHELASSGPYYSWSNKSIWSRIDRVFINSHWYGTFDFTHTSYLAPGLSDHSPLEIQFHNSPKPKAKFQYCDMWSSHPTFTSLVTSHIPSQNADPFGTLCHYLDKMRPKLSKLYKQNYADLQAQQEKARDHLCTLQLQMHMDPLNRDLKTEEKLAKEHYVAILSSSMALIKQQCKIEWLKYGDDCTKLFMAKSKQRKLANYIYSINESTGQSVEGFDKVGTVFYQFYQNLLGSQDSPTNKLDPEIIALGPTLSKTQ